jgi:hypothetical protein
MAPRGRQRCIGEHHRFTATFGAIGIVDAREMLAAHGCL